MVRRARDAGARERWSPRSIGRARTALRHSRPRRRRRRTIRRRSVTTLEVPCPFCGPRPSTEFTFGGERRELDAPDPEADFARVFHPSNARGPQRERWYHAFGCKTWFDLTRDTRTNGFV